MENTAPKWLIWTGILLIVWNAIGVFMFWSQYNMDAAAIAALPQDQQTLLAQMPGWAWIAFGIATIGGLLGAIGLTLRKSWAVPVTLISLVAIFVQFVPAFFLSKGVDVWQPQYFGLPLLIIAIALVQLWLARKAKASGWLS